MAQGDVGIYASQISGHLWAPNGAYDALATVSPSGTNAVTFLGIPQGYKHLQIRYISRNSVNNDQLAIQFNGDTAANYSRHELSGFGGSVYSGNATSQTQIPGIAFQAPSVAGANILGVGIIDILDYASTTKNKTVRCLCGYDYNGGGGAAMNSGSWMSTAAVTSLSINQQGGGNFAANSQFAIYGVK